ncbi:hypothetical protein Tco_1155492 [Tanacetum coccineum]
MASTLPKHGKVKGVDVQKMNEEDMHFNALPSMNVVYVLTTPMLKDGGEIPTMEQNVETSKELWDTLEAKYMAEDASSKKFLHKMNMDESIKVSCIIDKLPASWKDFKHTLKHLKQKLTLIEYYDNKGKRKHRDTRANPSKKPKVTCWKEMDSFHPLKDDDVVWWVDSGAIVHMCKDRCCFKTYESLNDGSILYIGNESTTLVLGRGCVD